jgi:hypothetical protein
MGISFVGSAEGSQINGGDITLTLPAMVQNDLVIVAYAIGDNDAVDFNMAMVTSGYTEVADLFSNDDVEAHLGVFWKVMGATPDTTAQVDGLGGTDAAVAAVTMVFRGVDPVTPMDVTPVTATGLNTIHPDPPSINHNNPPGVWTVLAVSSVKVSGDPGTYTFPTGYTVDALDATCDDTVGVSVGMGYNTNPSDPEDPAALVLNATEDVVFSWCGVTIALRPAPTIPAVVTAPLRGW